MVKIIYQTLEDRGDANLDKLENDGPYQCRSENSWLGDGYYFWDTFIENAHWWGKEVRAYSSGYIICRAICDFNDTECYDLVGNTEHLQRFQSAFNELKADGLANETTKVRRIIEFLKSSVKTFNYSAIRAYGIKSKNVNSKFSFNLSFDESNKAYLDLKPAIQICFYTKKSMNLRNYKIIYPETYSEDFVV